MKNLRVLLVHQLDEKLKPFKLLHQVSVPPKGWINNIRLALNMSLEQLGRRLKITKQGVKKMEEREAQGAISINSLKEFGKAMDMQFVYGFVPINGTVEDMVDTTAQKLAKKIVLRTNQNMKLENQGNSEKRLKFAIDELASEIKREMRKSLWD